MDELALLAGEVRERIIQTVSQTGGHLAANLGVVELTLALLKVFSPPKDKIIWDVSHQCYAYKLLTDRKAAFETLRQHGGISGFARREESPFDAFGAGHAGTALSAALGMAVGRDRHGGKEHVVAVVGDASVGCGVSFEALNNLAETTQRLIVILNDNEMSIAENVGSFSRYLGGLLANPRYNRWKTSVETAATKLGMGFFRALYYRLEEAVKSLFLGNVIFEEFGLRYVGPINGHSLPALVDALTIARDYPRPILLHVSTQKGRGYSFAEEQPEKWHGTPGFDVNSGEPLAASGPASYSSVFGHALERLAEQDPRIVAITAAMAKGTGMSGFAKRFPDRFLDVGISEEHAVVFAAGLATQGFVPVFAVYSTFLQRAVDYVIHDVCLQRLPVVICLDRAGVVGDDGPTHHGVFDLALLRPVPDLIVMQPMDERELADMLYTATRAGRPAVIRYPRGAGPGTPVPDGFRELEIGRSERLRDGDRVQIWALGDMVPLAQAAADALAGQGVQAAVWNVRFVKPLDGEAIRRSAAGAAVVATIENGVVTGGFGGGVEEVLTSAGYTGRILKFGWPDRFVPHGDITRLMDDAGLTAPKIAKTLLAAIPGR
jgi:1-deoxy-D-xylulose-5-phosphate synthase